MLKVMTQFTPLQDRPGERAAKPGGQSIRCLSPLFLVSLLLTACGTSPVTQDRQQGQAAGKTVNNANNNAVNSTGVEGRAAVRLSDLVASPDVATGPDATASPDVNVGSAATAGKSASLPAATSSQSAETAVKADQTLVKRFENAIARDFLDQAKKLLSIEGALPRVKLKQLFDEFSKDVDQELLTAYNYRQWELLGFLLEAETLRRSKTDLAGTLTRLTSLQPDLPTLQAGLDKELDRLGQLIGKERGGNPSHPADTVTGRQEYLDRLAETLHTLSQFRVGNINPFVLQELAINGDETVAGLFRYLPDDQTLTVGLAEVSHLPYFELPALAAFYGFPGLHTLHASAADTEVQQFFALPGYTRGWALYITAWLGENYEVDGSLQSVRQDILYWVRFQLALAKADLMLAQGKWQSSDAWLFLADFRRYGNDRVNLALRVIESAPGLHLAIYAGYQRFQQLNGQCVENADCNLDQLHQRIVILGPLTFRLLEANLGKL